MFAKACRILVSSGLAPNNEDTWKLIREKHPEGPLPIIPETTSAQSISLNDDFDVYNILKSFPKGTAAGPSGLRVQHLLDAASIPLPTTIGSLLRRVVNLLVSGKVPQEVSLFMAGGSLTALSKLKPGCAPDIRPIAVGEVLRRLTGKCLCAVLKQRVIDFFEPIQFGVACPMGSEKQPSELKVSNLPHFEILGCPIGDYIYCANFIASKRLQARKLLLQLKDVAATDPQVALTLLRLCGSFCRLSYLARSTPTDLVLEAFKLFDDDIHHCFMDCIGFATSDEAWCQAQLGLNSGGLGLRSLSLHSSSAYIASVCSSGVVDSEDIHLTNAIDHFNSHVSPIEKLSVNSIISSPVSQKLLSSKVNDLCFQDLFDRSSPANKARLLSVSAPHATSWLSVIPSTSQGLHLDPIEFRVAVKWWLGLDTSQGSQCAFCPAHSLDPLGHHALTCKCGGDAVLRHNALRDTLVHFLHRAHASVQVEVGAGLFPDHSQSRPADILLQNWNLGRPVALDISVVSPLNPSTLAEAGATFGAVLEATESRKHQANDEKCSALGWVSTPLAVDSYGAWGKEATLFLAQVAARLSIHKSLPKSQASFDLFSNLSICLIRANARAILRRV
eukprot:Em0001g3315a